MARSTRNNTYVGRSLAALLDEKGASQGELAESLNVTSSYISQVTTGRRTASPQWLDLVSETMKLTPEQQQELHQAGALDAGYKLDLTKP